MRKLGLFFSGLLFMATVGFAQKGFEFGARGMYQNTWLINSDDFAEGADELSHEVSFGPAYGISLGYNFSDYMGVRTNILLSTVQQKYKGNLDDLNEIDEAAYSSNLLFQRLATSTTASDYTASVMLRYIKIPLLFRANSFPYKGAFFSFVIGPQYNMLQSARHVYRGEEVNYSDVPGADFQTKELYTESTIGAVMGLGADISLTDLLKLNIALRFDYTIQDAENKSFQFTAANLKYWGSDDNPRSSTNPASAGFLLGITYTLQ